MADTDQLPLKNSSTKRRCGAVCPSIPGGQATVTVKRVTAQVELTDLGPGQGARLHPSQPVVGGSDNEAPSLLLASIFTLAFR